MDKRLSRLTTEQRADLVAYVDGELDEAATARIEKLLAENPIARKEVESLISTYELLGALPQPRASQEFVDTTLATARLQDVQGDLTESRAYRAAQQGLRYAGWIAAMIVCGLIGYSVTRFWIPSEYDGFVRDLDVVRRLDQFQEVGDVSFLDRLAGDPLLMDEMRGEQQRGGANR